ncbi:MAG: SatD family protein [Candidatus Methanoperedens sp.]|nr:SatD family protein [Candidatus Methanoperedens sp.]
MTPQFYVLSGDVLSSRRMKNKEAFQKTLEKACRKINKAYAGDIYADFKILKGIDEMEGVLLNISHIYGIVSSFLEQIYPHSMRFVLASGSIDTSLESRNVSKMDGPAFHKAYDMMGELKRSNLLFDMSTDNETIDALVGGEINSLLLLKGNWSAKQYMIVKAYREKGSQYEAAKTLGITQQTVSKALTRAMWKEIESIENRLNHALLNLPQKTTKGDENP